MAQISFKIPDEEYIFLKWYAEKTANSISTLYREATIESFRQWKMDILCNFYAQGSIGFKQLCKQGGLSFQEGMLLIEKRGIEPPISEAVDKHTSEVAEKVIKKLENTD